MQKTKIEWHDSDKIDQVFQAYVDGKPEYPVICPDCGNRSVHIYINKYKDTHRGGSWAWCSECYSYGHYSCMVPSWWSNHTCVDAGKLCGANPDELAQYESVLDEHVNSQLMRYCMSDNVCQYCLHKNNKATTAEKCPECGKETWMTTLDGPCMIISCSNCGYKVVGVSFLPPCHNDAMDYIFMVREVEKEKKIKLAKLFYMNVMDLMNELKEKGEVKKSFKIFEAESVFMELDKLEIDFDVSPNLINKYPDLIGCKCFV